VVVVLGEALVVAEVGFETDAAGDHATVYEMDDEDVDAESSTDTCNKVLLPYSMVTGLAEAVIWIDEDAIWNVSKMLQPLESLTVTE